MAQYYNTIEDQIIVRSIVKGSLIVDFYYSKAEGPTYSQLP
jgi:hypothetical protein